jgi:hypothetical protein
MTAAVIAPRPARRPGPRTLMALVVCQPLSLSAGIVLWPLAGARVTAALGMTGLTCLLLAVWLMPRDDPWRRPPGDDGGDEPDPPTGGPGTLDWNEFERLRGQWEAQRALSGAGA